MTDNEHTKNSYGFRSSEMYVEEVKIPEIPEEPHIHQKTIDQLKAASQTIFNNAESIVGTEPTLLKLNVNISIYPGEAPVINIDKDIYVES